MDESTKHRLHAFVCESIAISDEVVNTKSARFVRHYQTAVRVLVDGPHQYISPSCIYVGMQPTLSGDVEERSIYRQEEVRYRSPDVRVQPFTFPSPSSIGALLQQSERVANRLCLMGLTLPETERARRAEDLMLQGLAILPFPDENRRVFRLYHNALRLRLGLSWLDVSREDKQFYDELVLGFRATLLAD